VPIGQPEDASARLRAALQDAPVIAAEDTRRVRRLAAGLGVRLAGRVVSDYDDVETQRTPALLAELRAGRGVLPGPHAGAPGGRAGTCCWSPTRACRGSATPATGWWPPRRRPACRSRCCQVRRPSPPR